MPPFRGRLITPSHATGAQASSTHMGAESTRRRVIACLGRAWATHGADMPIRPVDNPLTTGNPCPKICADGFRVLIWQIDAGRLESWPDMGRSARVSWDTMSDTPCYTGDDTVTEQEIEAKVIEIVAEQMGADKSKITRDTSFVEDLNADSLDTVELVMEFEDEFETSIPDDQAEKIQTVGQAVDFIKQANGVD